MLLFFQLLFLIMGVMGQWPGPRQVSPDPANPGGEIWVAQVSSNAPAIQTYTVNTLVPKPTLVYNCNYMLSICRNARGQSQFQNGALDTDFHYDRLSTNEYRNNNVKNRRTDARRDQVCPTGWINIPGPNGGQRCPEAFQPAWYSEQSPNIQAPIPALMYQYQGVPDRRRLARTFTFHDYQTNQDHELFFEMGAGYTCDEFPAASWIEGGGGASTTCAPQASSCDQTILDPYTGQTLRVPAARTEQDWQGSAHGALARYFQTQAPAANRNTVVNDPLWTISKFHFNLSYADTTTRYATWVEVGGVKRYCYGPLGSGCV